MTTQTDDIDRTSHSAQLGTAQAELIDLKNEMERVRFCITTAMGQLDPESKSEDERKAHEWLRKAMTGTEG